MKRSVGVALLLALGAPALLPAQYFGQNKVQYLTFDFKIIQTEHFQVYFYERERTGAMDVARMAERSYARLSRVLSHRFRDRKPIILYASHSDFQQTNVLGGESPGEGTGGVTEAFRHRNVMPLTGYYKDIEEVLQHEMVHQFQYDIWSRGRPGNLGGLIALNPPGWFAEGMAAYLSRGQHDPDTEMWLRDAALEGRLPTIDQLANDPRIFPYRFGQAIFAFIGERWGDEAIGAILQGTVGNAGGIEGAVHRAIGLTLRQLSDQWRDAVQRRYLPEVADKVKAREFSQEILTEPRSQGTLHLAPALSPDGSQVAYFSEKDFFFVDLYLADAADGRVKRRLLKSTFSSNYETYRFINSSASWSPDGRLIAVAGKRGPRDEILVIDPRRNKQVRRIRVDLNGITTPTWSPDGTQLVFTGYDGGISDLFIINLDGTGLRRLTQDKYADLHPVWSPDGRTIAFATDRGPDTDFNTLRIGDLRIALYHLDDGTIEVLPHMEGGKNVSPQWSPDGGALAFVSDRTGVSNVFLYDFSDREVYQLTDLYTGAQGITPISPVLSWAHGVDRLAFVYYEQSQFDVYGIDNPRALKRAPFRPRPDSIRVLARDGTAPAARPGGLASPPDTGLARANQEDFSSGSLYRTPQGFRSAAASPADGSGPEPATVSITALLDSAELNLPDTAEFTVKKYKVKFTPDYVARPVIGYERDNFGRGFFGGSAIVLSDMLNDHSLVFAGFVNGRLSEAEIQATYIDMSRRINWATGLSQEPYYFFDASQIETSGSTTIVTTNLRRLVLRSAFVAGYYPVSRFQRVEAGLRLANVDDAVQHIRDVYSSSGLFTDEIVIEENLPGVNYAQPSLALTFDNSLMGWVGPFYGRRWRLQLAQTVGDWRFTQALADYRRYDHLLGPFTLATRALYFGRLGRNSDEFPVFLGHTDLLRGNTSGSYRRHECRQFDPNSTYGCAQLDRLVGTQLAVGGAELRFPILNPSMGFVPLGVPPIEGALFYDIGLVWDQNSDLKWRREPGDDPVRVRAPLQTFGASVRANFFGFLVLRLDYSIPQERRAVKGYWTLSLGPTF